MQTIQKTPSPFAKHTGSNVPFKRSSPPPKVMAPKASPSTCDQVALSAKSTDTKPKSSLWATAVLGGLAAMSVAGCVSSGTMGPAVSQTAPAQVEQVAKTWESAPVEMLRQANGEVVFNLGIDDQVVNPDLVSHYKLAGADNASWAQRDKTVCEQARGIGGECEADNIATVTTPHGTLIIEQNEANSIDVYSQDGGHTGIRMQADGVEVNTYQGNAFFANDGSILRR